ncbi:unnamed protein product [Gadus morhua 'NCC']
MEGSSVNLTCTSEANPVAKYTWSKVPTDHPPGHTVQGQQLSFHSIQSSDSGQYLCTAKNDLGTKSSTLISIDVKYAPKTPSVSMRPPGGIKEGGSVTLSCSSDANPAADYTWFRDNQPLPWEPRRPYTLDPVRSKDRGTYRCQAENQYGYLGSNSVFIDVQYAPKTPSVSVRPPGEIKEGGSVTLSCSSDANPAADYTWFREHGGSVGELGENYTISNITTELGGNYYCEARNAVGLQNSTLMFLNVTATPSSPSSGPTTVAAGTVAVLLASILLIIFLWMRRKRASRKAPGQGGRSDTRQESPPCPVYDNVPALTNRSASAARRESIEEQDDPHYPSIHFSRSKNQEVPRGFAGALVKSYHTEQVLYSAINLKRPKAVPEHIIIITVAVRRVASCSCCLTGPHTPPHLPVDKKKDGFQKPCAQGGRPDTGVECLNVLWDSPVRSDQIDQVLYSLVNSPRPNAVPGDTDLRVLYITQGRSVSASECNSQLDARGGVESKTSLFKHCQRKRPREQRTLMCPPKPTKVPLFWGRLRGCEGVRGPQSSLPACQVADTSSSWTH